MTAWSIALYLVLGAGLIAYALTGGADLGAGVWSLFARGERKAEQRQAVRDGIAPIWEANHVWLIFVIVVMFTAFPKAFSTLSVALHVPLALALVGIVLRGTGYTFHAYGIQSERSREAWAQVFSWSSLATPFLLGTVIAAVGSGAIRVEDGQVTSGYFAGWTSLFALAVGLFTLLLVALLAAVYLAAETEGQLQADFRARALLMECLCAAVAALVLLLARWEAPQLFSGLLQSSWTWAIQASTALAASLTLLGLWKGEVRWARFSAAAQVALVVVGWGLAMDYHFIVPDVSLANAGTRPEIMPVLVAILGGGTVILAPALFYLYRVFKR